MKTHCFLQKNKWPKKMIFKKLNYYSKSYSFYIRSISITDSLLCNVLSKTTKLNLLVSLHRRVCINFSVSLSPSLSLSLFLSISIFLSLYFSLTLCLSLFSLYLSLSFSPLTTYLLKFFVPVFM